MLNAIPYGPFTSGRRDGRFLANILSALTPDGEDVRESSIESITLRYVDASKFFTRHSFPKLRYLHLSTEVRVSSWEHLGLHTTALTTLSITIKDKTSIPNTAQLLLILTSNPRLQHLTLSRYAIPCDGGGGSTTEVPLRHLKKLSVNGNFHRVFRLLQRLDYPARMDETKLAVSSCTVENILGTVAPCAGDCIQRDGRFSGGLGVFISSLPESISIHASAISGTEGPTQKATFMTFTAIHRKELPPRDEDQLCTSFLKLLPVEHVIYFGGDLGTEAIRGTISTMPNIQELHLVNAQFNDRLLQPNPKGPHPEQKLLPSLRHLRLEDISFEDDNWQLFLPYLIHQTSGGQRISVTISGLGQHICKDVMKEIEGLVDELILNLSPDSDCPFDYCVISEEEWRGGW